MATRGPKQESLSRYFKDLDEYECSNDESDDEINKADTISGDKVNTLTSQQANKSISSNSKSDSDKKCLPSHESDSNTSNTDKKHVDAKSDTDAALIKSKLPSALDCLSTRSNPTFLKLSEKKEVNWDECPKRLTSDSDVVENPNCKSNAVPPPSSYEPITDPGIKVVDSEGRKRKTIADDLEDQMTSARAYKVHKDNDGDNDGS